MLKPFWLNHLTQLSLYERRSTKGAKSGDSGIDEGGKLRNHMNVDPHSFGGLENHLGIGPYAFTPFPRWSGGGFCFFVG